MRTFLLLGLATSAHAAEMTQTLDGAGTTNPSPWFWQTMNNLEVRIQGPVKATYRAVGSTTGQKEFVGSTNGFKALNAFGAGDIPMTEARYKEVTVTGGRQMVHVPFILGAIGVFHSVPDITEPIKLTSCLLAKIFSATINTWDDPEILAINPSLTYKGAILPVHRVKGSSSTTGFTTYLNTYCPDDWKEDGRPMGQGSTIVWPASEAAKEGSGGMSTYIRDNDGAIGYIDAGHGHDNNLDEIALKNLDGTYLTTTQALAAGGVGDAAAAALKPGGDGSIPADPTASFAAVSLLNQPGENTWPITMMSYLYLNTNLTTMNGGTAGLLMAFVEMLLDTDGQLLAQEKYSFAPLPQSVLDYNTQTLNLIKLPSDVQTYTFEKDTKPEAGAAPLVISDKRRSYDNLAVSKLELDVKALEKTTNQLSASVASVPHYEHDPDETFALACAALAVAAVTMVLSIFLVCLVATGRSGGPVSKELGSSKAGAGAPRVNADSV